jgi:FhaA, N-terminal domain/FHA domain
MSMLRNIEQKLEGLVQGAFSRAFKSGVQPVELARKLVREMESHKAQSISRVYVPSQYTVWLSPQDREQFSGYEAALTKELSDHLLDHARSEGLTLVTRPTVAFQTDDRLGVGEFGIQAALLRPPEDDSQEPQQAGFGQTMVYSPGSVERPIDEEEAPPAAPTRALLVGEGRRRMLSGDRLVLGRSRESDIRLEDPNVSRRHAELRREGDQWTINDLGSTNGVKVNGRRVDRAQLEAGDQIVLGTLELSFEVE